MQRKNNITRRKNHKKDKCNNTIKGKTLVLSSYCIITYITYKCSDYSFSYHKGNNKKRNNQIF